VLNSFTPETERTTHYFWSTVRSWGLDDANVSKVYKDMTDLAFAEDARIVELQQELIDSDTSGTPAREPCLRPRRSGRTTHHQTQARRRDIGAGAAGSVPGAGASALDDRGLHRSRNAVSR